MVLMSKFVEGAMRMVRAASSGDHLSYHHDELDF